MPFDVYSQEITLDDYNWFFIHNIMLRMEKVIKVKDIVFDKKLFVNYLSGTVLDILLCSYRGLPKGVNYMIIGDPGVGKTTIILDLMETFRKCIRSHTPN